MRKRIAGKQLGRSRSARVALVRSLVRGLVIEGAVVTTEAKAKMVQPWIEKLMSAVRKGGLEDKRRVLAKLGNDKEVAKKLFVERREITIGRNSGYTRIVKMPRRLGDNARMARLEWVSVPTVKTADTKKKTGKKKVTAEVKKEKKGEAKK